MDILLPEFYLLLTLMALVIAEVTFYGESRRPILLVTPVGLGVALLQVVSLSIGVGGYGQKHSFLELLVVDQFSVYFKLLFIGLAFLISIFSYFSEEVDRDKLCEYHCFTVAAALGMSIAASAVDFVLLFLCLQLVNVMAFLLAGYKKRSIFSNEASIKYLVSSVVASGLMIYGIALLYGHTHTFNLNEVIAYLRQTPMDYSMGIVTFGVNLFVTHFLLGSISFFSVGE